MKRCFLTLIAAFVPYYFDAVSAQAQTLPPITVAYSCSSDSPSSLPNSSGPFEILCVPPALPFRDGYRCYFFGAEFDTRFGRASIGGSLLLSPTVMSSGIVSDDKVCLLSAGASYETRDGAGLPVPFTTSTNLLGTSSDSKLLLDECALFAKLGKAFRVDTFNGPLPEPWTQSDGLTCSVTVSARVRPGTRIGKFLARPIIAH